MFFLKHVLPLVIISVLIGYVVARVGFPPTGENAEAVGNRGNNTVKQNEQRVAITTSAKSGSPEPDPDDIIRRVREAVSGDKDAESADDRDSYAEDVNSEIEVAAGQRSRDNLLDAVSAPQKTVAEATEPAVSTTIADPEEKTETPDVTVVKSPVAAHNEEESVSAENVAVAVALVESPSGASNVEEEPAAAVAAEVEEQPQAAIPDISRGISLEELLATRWTLGNEPVAPHLPSFITSCKSKAQGIECWSGEYAAQPNSTTKTKTKSIIRDFDASGFTIRYRNMVTNPEQQKSYWEEEAKQLHCTFEGHRRIRCEDRSTGQEITYNRASSEQFASRFTLSSLAATRWHSAGQPAVYLPSSTTRCDSEADKLACWTRTRTVQSDQGQNTIKTKSLIRKTGEGSFSVTYKDLVTNTAGETAWEADTHSARCKVMGFERIVCEGNEGSRSFAKAVLGL